MQLFVAWKKKTEVAATNIIATIAATDEDDDDKEVVDTKWGNMYIKANVFSQCLLNIY